MAATYPEWCRVLADALDAVFADTDPPFALQALEDYRAWEAGQR